MRADISFMTLDADVIIVGGGLNGAAAALSLAKAGLDVIALDARAETIDEAAAFDGRAYAVALASQRFWRAVGAWDRVAGVRILNPCGSKSCSPPPTWWSTSARWTSGTRSTA